MMFHKIPRRAVTTYPGEFKDVMRALWRRKFRRGTHVADFERRFAEFIGVPHAIATGSGRQAMEFILNGLELKPGDQIIFPAYTHRALPEISQKNGWEPVFADIDPRTFHLTAGSVEKVRTDRSRAVMATHLFGSACLMDEMAGYCKSHGMYLIEDCAQSCGARYKNSMAGTFGDAAFFSFSTDKIICAFGGGMIVTKDNVLASNIRSQVEQLPCSWKKVSLALAVALIEILLTRSALFSFLFAKTKSADRTIAVYRKVKNSARAADTGFSDLQAMVGLKQLNNLKSSIETRRDNALQIMEKAGKNAEWQEIPESVSPVYYQLILCFPDRISAERAAAFLSRKGIDTGAGQNILDFCPPLFDNNTHYPGAERVYECALQVPNHCKLSPMAIKKIADELRKVIPSSKG